MSNGTNPPSIKGDINRALVVDQQAHGLQEGAPNLFPGTAARVAAEVTYPLMWELVDMVERHRTRMRGVDLNRLDQIKEMLRR